MLAGLMRETAQQMEGLRMARVGSEHPAIKSFGLNQIAALMAAQRFVEDIVRGWHG